MADVTVGSVEALLKVRDEMTAGLKSAEAELAKLTTGMGTTSGAAKTVEGELGKVTAQIKSGGQQLQQANPLWSQATSMIMRFAGPLALGLAVKRTIEWADNLDEMSQATGVSTSKLQQLEYAAKQNGTTFDNLITTIGQMNNRLASGDASAVGAIRKLGLSFEELQRQSPDEQMLAIGEALKGVTSAGDRTAIAMDLFGRSGMRLLPTLLSLNETMAKAPVLADEQVRALGHLNDAWDALKTHAMVALGETVGGLVSVLNAIRSLDGAQASVALQDKATGRFLSLIPGAGGAMPAQAAAWWVGMAQAAGGGAITAPKGPEASSGWAALVKDAQANPTGIDWDATTQAADRLDDELKRVTSSAREARAETAKLLSGFEGVMVGKGATEPFWAYSNQTAAMNAPPPSAGFEGVLTGTPPAVKQFWDYYDKALVEAFNQAPAGAKAIKSAGHTIQDSFSDLTEAFQALALIAGPNTDEFTRAVGSVVATMNLGFKAGQQLKSAIDDGNVIGILQGAISAAAALYQSAQSMSRGQNIANSALTGASIGYGVAGYGGAAVGAGLGALWGALSKAPEKQLNDLRDQYVESYGGFLALADKAEKAGAGFALNQLLQAKNQDQLTRATQRLEAAFAQFDLRISRVTESLGGLTEKGGLLSAATMREILANPDNPDIQAALAEFLPAQTAKGVAGLSAVAGTLGIGRVTAAKKELQAAQEGGKQEEIAKAEVELKAAEVALAKQLGSGAGAGLGGAAVGLWGAMASQGMSVLDILDAMGPTLDTLGQAFSLTGISGGAAFTQIQSLATFAAKDGVPSLLTASQGLNDVLEATHNTGLLNQDMFSGLAEQVGLTYGSLKDQGADGDQALRLMQPTLQTLWELQRDFGYKTDEATGKLLTQAEEGGLVGDKFRPATDRMVLAIEGLITKFEEFLLKFDDIPASVPDPFAGWKPPVIPDLSGVSHSPASGQHQTMAAGGIVTRPTMALIGESGPEAVIPLSRGGLGGGTTQIVIQAWDGASVERWLKDGGARLLTNAVARTLPAQLRLSGVR